MSHQTLPAPVSPSPLSWQMGTARCPLLKGSTLIGGSNGLFAGFGFSIGSMGPSGKGMWAGKCCRGSEQPPNLAGTGAVCKGAIPATFPDPSLLLGE